MAKIRGGVAGLMLALVGAAAAVLFIGDTKKPELSAAWQAALPRPAGYPQLVSVEPLPREGKTCELAPASDSTTLLAAVQRPLSARAAPSFSADVRTAGDADRPPVRVLRDTFATYSAIAVDINSNEVFLQDENLFGIKVFNRLDHTPPGANFTEPKRILGGLKTKLEFNCSLYIDPKSGDIYSVANDTVDTMVVFPRDAQGNVAPMRELRTPHGTYGIAVNEEQQQLFLTVQHDNAVVVYPKTAQGEVKPIRKLEGERTHLEDPHGIAVDSRNGWMFVANHGSVKSKTVPGSGKFDPPSITVYPLKASGDAAPLRIIAGTKTQLNWPANLYLDLEQGELYVANDSGDSILVFRESDSGDVSPLRMVKGAKTGIRNPTGIFVDTKNRELWVSNMSNYTATVYPRTANGDVAPLRTIRSAPQGKVALVIGNPGAVGYDSKRGEILVPN